MNDAEVRSDNYHCPECGALLSDDAQTCWLCHRQRVSASSSPSAKLDPARVRPTVSPRHVESGWSYSLETLMAVMTLAAVGMGAIVLFPGIGILLAILLLPAFVRTSMVVSRRAEQGRQIAFWQRAALFIGSFATSIVILVVVAVASVGTFCALCLGLAAGGAEGLAWPVAIAAAVATTVTAVVLCSKWARRRWRRDTEVK